jgi:ANTAR domain-containing protein/GAF domain-containing protein
VDVSLRGVPRLRALAVIEEQVSGETPRVAASLQRLCLAVTHDLDLAGATVTLMPDVGREGVAAVSSPTMYRAEEAQLEAGEGPTRDAYGSGRPVVVVDRGSLVARWPTYAPEAIADGVSAVFSLPLQVGASRLGALTLYWHSPLTPAAGDLRRALVFADLGTEFLIDHTCSSAGGHSDPDLMAALETHGHVYQAQGMVMVDLGVGLTEALARMRSEARASHQSLAALAARIVAGATVDPPAPNSHR